MYIIPRTYADVINKLLGGNPVTISVAPRIVPAIERINIYINIERRRRREMCVRVCVSIIS